MAPEAAASTSASVSLARVVWLVQHHYGAGWYFAPDRWATGDGYAPFPIVVHAYRAALGHQALQRLSDVRAYSLAMCDPKERGKHVAEDQRLAGG